MSYFNLSSATKSRLNAAITYFTRSILLRFNSISVIWIYFHPLQSGLMCWPWWADILMFLPTYRKQQREQQQNKCWTFSLQLARVSIFLSHTVWNDAYKKMCKTWTLVSGTINQTISLRCNKEWISYLIFLLCHIVHSHSPTSFTAILVNTLPSPEGTRGSWK